MRIFHYTDLNGLKGILDSNAFWATNIFFLNDKNESLHGCECFTNTVRQLNADIFSEERKLALLKAVDAYKGEGGNEKSPRDRHVYSISFCKESDKLSQWRGYGNKQGICLEFESLELIDLFDSDGLNVYGSEVLYTNATNTVAMNGELKKFFKSSPFISQDMDDHFAIFASTYMYIGKIIPFFKDEGFAEEEEYRFVVTPDNKIPNVEYRINENGIIPYIILEPKDKKKLPIKSVRIGPAKDISFIKEGLRFILESKGYGDIPIENSIIPYRG